MLYRLFNKTYFTDILILKRHGKIEKSLYKNCYSIPCIVELLAYSV